MSIDKQIEEMARFLWKCTLIPNEELCSELKKKYTEGG